MEVSPTELMNILNRIISKRKIMFVYIIFRIYLLHIPVCIVVYLTLLWFSPLQNVHILCIFKWGVQHGE